MPGTQNPPRTAVILLVSAFVLGLTACDPAHNASTNTPQSAESTQAAQTPQLAEAPEAAVAENAKSASEAYLDWAIAVTYAIEDNIEVIVQSAEDIAKSYTEEANYALTVGGDPGFVGEAQGRSGGIMHMRPKHRNETRFKGAMVYALQEAELERDINTLKELSANGVKLVVVSRADLIEKVKQAGAKIDWAISNGNDKPGFIEEENGEFIIPTDTVADVAVVWTWVGEFVAACTRNGKMPTMYQGYAVPGGQERARRLERFKFHEEQPIPAPAKRFGPEFLRILRRDLERIRAGELEKIRETARRAVNAENNGNALYIFTHSHTLLGRPGCYRDPGYFSQINRGWWDMRRNVTVNEGDFVFCVGFDSIFLAREWNNVGQRLRDAGAQIAWSFTDYKEDDVKAVLPDEIWINQHWDFGDAVVEVPGYEIKICPTSGILGEVVMWMVHAEMHGMKESLKAQ